MLDLDWLKSNNHVFDCDGILVGSGFCESTKKAKITKSMGCGTTFTIL